MPELDKLISESLKHYLIFVPDLPKEPVGCTNDKEDVLCEEPDATFREVEIGDCSICKELSLFGK
jgi:hypothetical protein